MTTLRIEFHAGEVWFVCNACGEYSRQKLGLKCPSCGTEFKRIKLVKIVEKGADEPPIFIDITPELCGMISQNSEVGPWDFLLMKPRWSVWKSMRF